MYGPFILRGQITVITLAIVMAVTVIFGLTSFVAWKYWKTERDWKGLWKILIGLQIPAFSISGLSYEFYSGLKFQIGVGIKQTVNAMLGSNFLLVWNPHNTVFQFALNIGALILLVLLIKLEDMKRAADFSEN